MRAGVSISERRACGLMEIARSTMRRVVVESEPNQVLQAKIFDLAQAWRRFSYRRIHDLLRREGVQANHLQDHADARDAGFECLLTKPLTEKSLLFITHGQEL
jgi:putative transposase